MSTELETIFGEIDFVNDSDRGANNLNEWVKNSPNIIALINAVLPEIQEVHDAQQQVFANINIAEAVGTQLDDIFGTMLDLERGLSQTDDSYRLDLLAQASIISRSGEISVMKSVYKNLLSASVVSLYEFQPAAMKIEATVTTIPSASELDAIRERMVKLKQGGNNMLLSVTDSTMIVMGAFASPQLNSATGLSGPSHTGGTLTTGF